jgi:hypothetical protein
MATTKLLPPQIKALLQNCIVLKPCIINIFLFSHSLCKAMADALIDDYLNNLAGQNPRSAVTVGYYLKDFEQFANEIRGSQFRSL